LGETAAAGMSSAPGAIEGVLGPIPGAALGITLTHEHCLIDLRTYWNPPTEIARRTLAETKVNVETIGFSRRNPFLSADNLVLDDLAAATEELSEFSVLGGTTVVDLTPPDLGRDPRALQRLARLTGLNIICGCGHYISISHPASLAQEGPDDIADRLVAELTVGIADTGVRAGVIGEIGTSNPMDAAEEKVLRSAARAHRATGAPIAVHLSPPPRDSYWLGHEVLDILESEHVEPGRVLLCHLDNALEPGDAFARATDYHEELGRRGCFIGYDGCGKEHYFPSGSAASYPSFWCPHDRERARAASLLIERGLGQRLLISHDVCFKIELVRHGGFGYGHILRTFVTNLRDYGVDAAQIDTLLIENPRRFLAPGS
jgi:phosphotriesterase-related protein